MHPPIPPARPPGAAAATRTLQLPDAPSDLDHRLAALYQRLVSAPAVEGENDDGLLA
ncbi:MAG: hypothetical protein ACK5QW_00140 [Cyanobacteriota bacterium]